MTVQTDTVLEQQYDAWQNQILAQMGITRWVDQHCPVKTFDELTDLAVFFDSQTFDNPSSALSATENYYTETATQADIDIVTNVAVTQVPVVDDTLLQMQVQTQSFDTATGLLPSTLSVTAPVESALQDDSQQVDEVLTVSFNLQAIVLGDWTLVVDSGCLQQDERQQQLWQQITSSLGVQSHFFKFPLLADSDQLPTTTAQLMSSYSMAVAGFSGFLYSINLFATNSSATHLSAIKQGSPKVGALTRLPACLDEQPIQRLPYLDEMLEDYRLKRQLWQLLIR